jgi:hypothetical protein
MGHKNFNMKKIQKNKITWHLYQKFQKNPKKTLWEGGSSFANITFVQNFAQKKI